MVLAGAKSGIIFTIITLAVTVLVFVLAKVASAVKRGGGFDVVLKPIGLLDSHELRFNLSFENGSKKDRSLNDLSLAYMLKGELHVICEMAHQPLARGLETGFLIRGEGWYGFFIEAGQNRSAVIDYLLPASFTLPEGAKLCLSCFDESARRMYAYIDLRGDEPKLLVFKKLRAKV